MRTPTKAKNTKQALYNDADDEARRLKRKYRALYDADPHAFRAQVRKAHARVFRLKPGPKADARIARAARERDHGAQWRDLFPRYIDGYESMSEYMSAVAEEGFRRKVNEQLRRRRRSRKGTGLRTPARNRTR